MIKSIKAENFKSIKPLDFELGLVNVFTGNPDLRDDFSTQS